VKHISTDCNEKEKKMRTKLKDKNRYNPC